MEDENLEVHDWRIVPTRFPVRGESTYSRVCRRCGLEIDGWESVLGMRCNHRDGE